MTPAGVYLQTGTNRRGPFDEAALREAFARGEHAPETMSSTAGEAAWIPLAKRFGHGPVRRRSGGWLLASLLLFAAVAVLYPAIDIPELGYADAKTQAAMDVGAALLVVAALWRYARGAGTHERPRAVFASFVLVVLGIAGAALLALQWRVEFVRGQDPDATMTLSDDARVLRIDGYIGANFVADFDAALARAPALERIDIDSPGGLVDDALQVAATIAERGLVVRGVGECSSACVLLWAASAERELRVSSAIGLHQVWADEKLPSAWREEAIELHEPRSVELLESAGFSPALLAERARTPSDDIALIEPLRLLDEGVRFTAIAADGRAMTPDEVRAHGATLTGPNRKTN